MKKLFSIFILFFYFHLNAQKFTIKQGEEFETPGVVWLKENIESDSTGFYFVRNKNGIAKNYIYHKIDKTGKTVYLKETNFPSNGNVYNCNGKLLFFSYDDNSGNTLKTKNKISLYLTEVDSKTGEKISETKEVDYIETQNNNQFADIDISFSPDKKYLLVTSEIKEDKKKQRVLCRLYSTNGYKRIWEKEPITVYENSTVSSSEYSVDNKGNLFYIFGYVRSEHKNEFNQFDDVNFGIVCASAANASTIVKVINAKNKKIENIKTEIIENKLVCSGQFSDGLVDIDKQANRGFFIASLEQSDNPYAENFVYIDDKIESKVIYQKEKNGKDIKWTESKIFVLNNFFYVVKQRLRGKIADELLVIKYGQGFKFEWMKIIPKFSYSDKETGVNFIKTDKLNFIYYENLKNIESSSDNLNYDYKEYKVSMYDKDPVIIATMDENGNVVRKSLGINEQILLENQIFKDYHGNYLNSIVLPVRISNKKKRYDVLYLE